jgi:hypothetical protein
MSDYTQFMFISTQEQRQEVEEQLNEIWDAFGIKDLFHYAGDLYAYRLVISELALKDSLEFIDKIKKKHNNIVFVVEYGVYY